MAILLLDDTLEVHIYYEASDENFRDNICLCIRESCPDEERLFRAEENHIYLTPKQARELASALIDAADRSIQQGAD